MTARPIAENLFTGAVPARLLGARHRESGRVIFPAPADSRLYEIIELPDRGRIWSYTVQRFAPKSPPYIGPEPFEPFALGYVEMTDVVIVETRFVGIAPEELRIGLPVELVIVPLRTDTDGATVMSYAFRPQSKAAA